MIQIKGSCLYSFSVTDGSSKFAGDKLCKIGCIAYLLKPIGVPISIKQKLDSLPFVD